MKQDTKNPYGQKVEDAVASTSLEMVIRSRARSWIETIIEDELEGVLQAKPSSRVDARRGYRHGTRERTMTTSLGPTTIAMPRARLQQADGSTTEWQSHAVRRYQRRTELVDEAMLGVYLSGTNTRRIKGALAPLLRGGPLSKDAVSRLVGRLAEDFETWRTRDLAEDAIQYLLLDGWFPKVRIGRRRVRVPVLVTLGVRADGERIVLDVRLAGDESTAAWRDVIRSLVERHVGAAAAGDHRRQRRAGGRVARAVADAAGATLYHAQASEPRSEGARAAARGTGRGLPPHGVRARVGRRLNRRAPGSFASGSCGVRPSSNAWPRPATICSRSRRFRRRSGSRCARPTPSSASTGNSGAAPRRRRACQARTRSCSCSMGCCARDK